jgi:phospholipase/carboxylesterase
VPTPASAGRPLALEHLVRAPAAPPPAGARAPLLVLLHGLGSTEHAMFPLRHAFAPEFVVVSARGPVPLAGRPGGPQGRPHGPRAAGWFRVHPARPPGRRADMDDARASWVLLPRLAAEACAAYDADPARVVLVGFSQGGMTALAALLTAPEAFAGAAVLGGRLLAPALAAAAPAERLAGRRVLVAHGTDDPRVPVAAAREARDRLAALPLALEYHEFACRHAITDEMRRAVTRWAAEVAGVADRPADTQALERLRRARAAAPPAPPADGAPAAPAAAAPPADLPTAPGPGPA